MMDMLYIGSLLGSLIVIGIAVYPIACVIEAVSRERKKLRQVREHQDEAGKTKQIFSFRLRQDVSVVR